MDPLVNTKSVDQFFDDPGATVEPFGDGSLAGDFGGDTSETAYFNPTREGAPTDPQVPTEPVPPVPDAPTPDSAPPVTDTVDYAQENLRLQQQLAELQLYKPLGDMIQRNPKFLQAVEDSLKSLPEGSPQAPQILKPVQPQKPAQYDPAEAMSAPGSESWKYREATEAFQNEMFSYYEKKDMAREQAVQQAQMQYQQRIVEQQAHEQLTNQLMTQYGYTPDKVADFIKVMSDPASRSIANLVALHQMQMQKQAAIPQMQVKAAQKNVPLPAGVTGGGGIGQTKQLSEGDSFNLGLMSARR